MPHRERKHFDTTGWDKPQKPMIEATPQGKFLSNWQTAVTVVSVSFGLGIYVNAKSTAFDTIQETAKEARSLALAAASGLNTRMAKIEDRVGSLEVVSVTMDRKIDMIVRRTGAGPLVDAK